jgi:serine protease Do
MNRERLSWWIGGLGDRKFLSASLVLFTLAVGILIGTVISTSADAAKETPAAADAKPIEIPAAVPISNEFTKIADRIRPSVVNSQVESLPKPAEQGERSPREGDGMEDFFRRFFGLPEGAEPFADPRRRRRGPGQGSGVIVDENGYILTNRHVIEGADRIRVRLVEEDKQYDAELIGEDVETDIAVIRIKPGIKLVPAQVGNSSAVSVGDWAIAVGSPFGYRESVTVGIISAISREVQGAESMPFQKFLQTDAAINPGNSGGPLVNMRGEVIGINSAIVTSTGAYQGLGFALASNIAADVYNKIIRYGKVPRGSIGVEFGQGNDALLRTYGAADGGVFVQRITPEGGPADKAGIKPEDVIVEVAGKPIRNGDQLIDVVSSIPVGETVPVVVLRDKQRKTVQVEIADRAELHAGRFDSSTERGAAPQRGQEVLFGMSVRNLTATDRERLGYDGDDGVLVDSVEPASFADDLGIRADDIIVAINRRPVTSLQDAKTVQQMLKPGADVVFKVMVRQGQSTWTARYPAGQLPSPEGQL